ncbi:S6 family peptidase [Erwinia mallotivora]|uniref:S6 family peptidase n=1 Tax=Erwinia mallotivora TaxID=69222 RepID=UPI0021C06758|nr:S6 family peptidase [Erwinia mallotivora]
MKNKHFIYYCSFFISMTSAAGIMLPDIDVQEYRDFAENLEKYTTDASSVPVFKTDG